jgi:exopolysaccharide biosynthesis operon protein EpsL
MTRNITRAAVALAFLAPGAGLAQQFNTVDTIPWPALGRFPAYQTQLPRPTEMWVQAGALHDSNLFRLSSGADANRVLGSSDRSDTVIRAGGGIRHEQLIAGRQRLRLEASGDQYSYHRYTQLNHVAYRLAGTWLWELGNDLSGTVGYERRRRLIDLAGIQRPIKDLITEDHLFASGAYLLGPSVRLRGGVDGFKGSHSAVSGEFANSTITTVTGGADYVTTLQNSIGVEVRQSQAKVPFQEPVGLTLVNNEYTEKEVALVATYIPSSQLRTTGRIGHTRRHHKDLSQRDFSGTTWRMAADWTPLNKTGFELALYKEPRSIIDIAATYVVVKGVSFGPRWAPTEKLVFNMALVRETQDFAGAADRIVLGAPLQSETVRIVRFGAGWEPKRFVQLTAGFDHGIRSSNVLFRDYSYNAAMLNAKFDF